MTLWYYETVTMTGRWSPCTAPARPETVTHGGHEREKRLGGIGARIRRIVEVPQGLSDLPLNDLRRHFWGQVDEPAVPAQRGRATA